MCGGLVAEVRCGVTMSESIVNICILPDRLFEFHVDIFSKK